MTQPTSTKELMTYARLWKQYGQATFTMKGASSRQRVMVSALVRKGWLSKENKTRYACMHPVDVIEAMTEQLQKTEKRIIKHKFKTVKGTHAAIPAEMHYPTGLLD